MQTNYFEARGVKGEIYAETKLPYYFKEIIESLPKNAKILDFGCGFGQILNAIKNHNFAWESHKMQIAQNGDSKEDNSKVGDSNIGDSKVGDSKIGGGKNNIASCDDAKYHLLGIDINENALNHCKSLGIEALKIDNILDFIPQEKFDLIITTHCLEHLEKSQVIDILRHFRKHILGKNGKIFITVPNAQSATNCYWAYEDWTHKTLFTAGSLIYVLKMAGFSHIKIIDKDALAGSKGIKRLFKVIFLKIYKSKIAFWNKITNSAFHAPSPQVFSYEIKALAY